VTTRERAVADAGACIAEAELLLHSGTVADAARRAYTPTGPSLADLEAQILTLRTQTPAPDGLMTSPEVVAVGGRATTPRRAS
jgi:hypothetical protein